MTEGCLIVHHLIDEKLKMFTYIGASMENKTNSKLNQNCYTHLSIIFN